MKFCRLRLSYVFDAESPVFLTWRLQDSLPPYRGFPSEARNSGQAFAAMDRLLDEAREGPSHFRQPAVADMIVEAIEFNADILGHYRLHAFVVMPNHVHLLATPTVALPKLTNAVKGLTAARADAMLGLTGRPFWQDESYHRVVRYEGEFEAIWNYIEEDPVRAGMVRDATQYRWSSAAAHAIIPDVSPYRFTSMRSARNGWHNSWTRQDG
jgi:REP element-mobilizing transposase RayT